MGNEEEGTEINDRWMERKGEKRGRKTNKRKIREEGRGRGGNTNAEGKFADEKVK